MSNPMKDEPEKDKKPTGAPDKLETEDDLIDEASDESFPASDPPAMTGSTAGAPGKKKRD
jgi:hypothetical protein